MWNARQESKRQKSTHKKIKSWLFYCYSLITNYLLRVFQVWLATSADFDSDKNRGMKSGVVSACAWGQSKNCVKWFHFHYMNFHLWKSDFCRNYDWWELKSCHFYHKTVGCHSTENKYKWQNSMSVIHPELTNIAPGKKFASYIMLKEKKNSWGKWQTFTCLRSHLSWQRKEQSKNFQKKNASWFYLGMIYFSHQQWEFFFSHSSEEKAEPSQVSCMKNNNNEKLCP